jgi:hypothetical protein
MPILNLTRTQTTDALLFYVLTPTSREVVRSEVLVTRRFKDHFQNYLILEIRLRSRSLPFRRLSMEIAHPF